MISQTVIIPRSSAKGIYSLLLDTKLHTKLIGESAIIKPGVGSDFSLYSGYATGKITKLVPGKVIEQSWWAGQLPETTIPRSNLSLETFAVVPKSTLPRPIYHQAPRQSSKTGGKIFTGTH